MRTLGPFVRSTRATAFLFLTLATAAAWAQPSPSPPQATSAPTPKAPTAQSNQPTPTADPKADDELLAKTSRLYYSTRTTGLDGFDCQVHPDWHALLTSAGKGAPIDDDDPRILTLKPVRITVHARMSGPSTVEWVRMPDPEKPLDADASLLLDRMHEATEQAMQGFLQFWTPFIHGSVVPASSAGLRITRSATDFTLQGERNSAHVTEIFSNEMILQHFNLVTSGVSIRFNPLYRPTEKSLLVNHFDAHIEPVGQASAPAKVMHVQVLYVNVDGLPIPSNLNMEVVGAGTSSMALDGCHTIQRTQ